MIERNVPLRQRGYRTKLSPNAGFITVATVQLADQRPRQAVEFSQSIVLALHDLLDVVFQPSSQVGQRPGASRNLGHEGLKLTVECHGILRAA